MKTKSAWTIIMTFVVTCQNKFMCSKHIPKTCSMFFLFCFVMQANMSDLTREEAIHESALNYEYVYRQSVG